jgi:hypothetical protein
MITFSEDLCSPQAIFIAANFRNGGEESEK